MCYNGFHTFHTLPIILFRVPEIIHYFPILERFMTYEALFYRSTYWAARPGRTQRKKGERKERKVSAKRKKAEKGRKLPHKKANKNLKGRDLAL